MSFLFGLRFGSARLLKLGVGGLRLLTILAVGFNESLNHGFKQVVFDPLLKRQLRVRHDARVLFFGWIFHPAINPALAGLIFKPCVMLSRRWSIWVCQGKLNALDSGLALPLFRVGPIVLRCVANRNAIRPIGLVTNTGDLFNVHSQSLQASTQRRYRRSFPVLTPEAKAA
jgi:hypothetical protein